MDKKYHTLNEHIPADAALGGNTIGMDTGGNRDWLNLWIGHHEVKICKIKGKRRKIDKFVGQGVFLTRQDALNLIEEIRHRLF